VSRHPALITTVHDPGGRLLRALQRSAPAFKAYDSVYAFVTEVTHSDVADVLRGVGVRIEVGPVGVPGEGQRRVLGAAVEDGHAEMLCCDLDRWLHWCATYPKELSNLPEYMNRELPDAWYVCLERTDRAVATHPMAQILPETATNRALSAVVGKRLDATAGAAWIRLEGAALILAGSTATTKATDLEWPGLVFRADPTRLEGALFEGLEFETADSYPEEIERLGSVDAWIADTYDRPEVLRDRLQLAADSVAALIEVTGSRDHHV